MPKDGLDCLQDVLPLINTDEERNSPQSPNSSGPPISTVIGEESTNSFTFSLPNIERDNRPVTIALPVVRFSCDTCLLVFDRQCDLNKHNGKHIRRFKCTIAGCRFQDRGFATSKDLKQHMNTRAHRSSFAPESSSSCPRCSKKFTRKDNLHRHLRNEHL